MSRECLAGRRVVVVGLARQGSALVRFFCQQGAHVVVTDMRSASVLRRAIDSLGDLPVHYVLGEHPLTLLDECDLLCLSGGVPPETALPQEARRRGIPLSNDSLLTFHLASALVVGVTGSSGKTTTTALVGEMLKASGFKTWVGGNIGTPLIDRVLEVTAGDRLVLELSSFQLQLFAERSADCGRPERPRTAGGEDRQRQVAAILNITPNHLDRHPSMAHYTATKANILRFSPYEEGPSRDDVVVLGADNPITGRWWREGEVHNQAGTGQPEVRFPIIARRLGFSLAQQVSEGAHLQGDRLIWLYGGHEAEICATGDLKLLGRHNVANTLAALAISGAAGALPEAMRQVATTFTGVPHRLELVRELDGVRWYNDSIATAPERVVAALKSFDQPIVLLAGGRDKHLPWEDMADLALERVRRLVLFGEAADLIADQIDQARGRRAIASSLQVHRCSTLSEAVETAAHVAHDGDVVLLSPGGTSFDAYEDFEQRGEHFRALVSAL